MVDKIIELVCEVKEGTVKQDEITADSHMLKDVGLDSLQLVNLILLVEETFDVEIDFDLFDYSVLDSVKKFASFVEMQMEEE